MWVQAVDYLRILEGGNFVHFVAMARVPGDNVSLITTSEFRFKVCTCSPVLISRLTSTYTEHYVTVVCVHAPTYQNLNNLSLSQK